MNSVNTTYRLESQFALSQGVTSLKAADLVYRNETAAAADAYRIDVFEAYNDYCDDYWRLTGRYNDAIATINSGGTVSLTHFETSSPNPIYGQQVGEYNPNHGVGGGKRTSDWWSDVAMTIITTATSGGMAFVGMPIAAAFLGPTVTMIQGAQTVPLLKEISGQLKNAEKELNAALAQERINAQQSLLLQPLPRPQQQFPQWQVEQWLAQEHQRQLQELWLRSPQQFEANQRRWDSLKLWQQQQEWQEWRERMLRQWGLFP